MRYIVGGIELIRGTLPQVHSDCFWILSQTMRFFPHASSRFRIRRMNQIPSVFWVRLRDYTKTTLGCGIGLIFAHYWNRALNEAIVEWDFSFVLCVHVFSDWFRKRNLQNTGWIGSVCHHPMERLLWFLDNQDSTRVVFLFTCGSLTLASRWNHESLPLKRFMFLCDITGSMSVNG